MPALTVPNAVWNFIVESYSVIWAKVTSIHYTIKMAGNEAGWVCIVNYLPKLYSWFSGQHLLDLSPKNCQIQWMNHQDHPKWGEERNSGFLHLNTYPIVSLQRNTLLHVHACAIYYISQVTSSIMALENGALVHSSATLHASLQIFSFYLWDIPTFAFANNKPSLAGSRAVVGVS